MGERIFSTTRKSQRCGRRVRGSIIQTVSIGGIVLQRERNIGTKGRQVTDDRPTYRCRHLLQQLLNRLGLEICK